MSVYRFHHGMAATVIGDCIDQDLYEAGEAMRIVTESMTTMSCIWMGYINLNRVKHCYLLARFDLLPKYQKIAVIAYWIVSGRMKVFLSL